MVIRTGTHRCCSSSSCTRERHCRLGRNLEKMWPRIVVLVSMFQVPIRAPKSDCIPTDTYAARLKALFWIAVYNFVFPVLVNIAQLVLIYHDPNYVHGAMVQFANNFILVSNTFSPQRKPPSPPYLVTLQLVSNLFLSVRIWKFHQRRSDLHAKSPNYWRKRIPAMEERRQVDVD